MNKQIVVSAPGKVHFMGEHAVVYGKPALLGAVSLRCRATVIQNSKFKIKSSNKTAERLVREAVMQVRRFYKLRQWPKMEIEVESEIPPSRGLGASAAMAVASVGALVQWLGKKWETKVINELAYEVEKLQHGNPSGGDNSTSTYGGLVFFRKELDFLKVIEPLKVRIAAGLKPFFLIDSGKAKETTKEMVERVNSKFKIQNSKFKRWFETSEELTRRMAGVLKEGSERGVVDCLRRGERLLEKLGVVGKRARQIVREVESLGGGVKVTGAGGVIGGSGMLVVYHPEPAKLLVWSRGRGRQLLRVEIEEEGVRLENF